MTLSLEQLSARMRQGEDVPLSDTARIALALSIPSILEQLVVTAMEYIDAAMVGHIGAEATAAIGIVSSSTWLLHGILVGLYTAFSIQIAQYLGADRQQDARGVLRQSMLFNLILGLGAAAFGVGISRFLPGWLGADISLQADASAYFAIWSAALPFTMAMGMYTAMLRATGDGPDAQPPSACWSARWMWCSTRKRPNGRLPMTAETGSRSHCQSNSRCYWPRG